MTAPVRWREPGPVRWREPAHYGQPKTSAAIQQTIHNVNCERLRIPHGCFHYDPVPMLRRMASQGFLVCQMPLARLGLPSPSLCTACSRRWTSSACLPILDVLSTPKFAVASGETHDKNNGQHWCSPLSLCARFCDGQRRLLEAPERRDQADDRRPSRRALRSCAGAAAAAADHRDTCSGTRACGIIVVLR